jgi:uncharacterized protein YggE
VPEQPCIAVLGMGTATGIPDECVLHVNLNATATTPSEALDHCAEAANRVLSALGRVGIESRDVRTTNLSVQDFFDKASQRVTGRIGSYQLEIIIRSLDDVGRVVATLSSEAGDALQIRHLHLVVSDAAPLEKEARRLAVLDAQSKASQLTETAGVALGEILSIQDEGGRNGRPHRTQAVAAAVSGHIAASLPVEAGEVTASSSVVITYAIDS